MIPRVQTCICGHAGQHHHDDGCRLCPCTSYAHRTTRPIAPMPIPSARGRWRHGRVLGKGHPTRDSA